MSFLGAGFLAGLFGVVLPLAIHLFARRRRVNLPWGAMRFLEEAKPSWKRRSLRLQDLLILLLRVAAVACLALAFARPLLKLPTLPASKHHLVLIVDRSLSTELGAEGGRKLADEIHQHLTDLLERLPEETGIRLFVNGGGPGLRHLPPLTGRPINESRNRTAWLRELQTLHPGPDTLDWAAAIRSALQDSTIDEAEPEDSTARHVLVIADAATHGWPLAVADSDRIAKNTGAQSPADNEWTQLMAEIPGTTITLFPIGADLPQRQASNLCVDRITTDQRRMTPGKAASIRATVSNRGTAASLPATARWTAPGRDSAKTEEASIPALEPGAAHELVLRKAFPEAGPHAVRLDIDSDDALKNDNTATAVIEIIERLHIAVVSDDAPDHLEDPDDRFSFWAFAAAAGDENNPAAASPSAGGRSVFELHWLKPGDLAKAEWDDFAVVVWSAVGANRNLAERLRPFVSKGGGLWLRPPREVIAEAFNEAFFPHEYGLSPAAITSANRVQGHDDNPFGLRPASEADEEDPFARYALSALAELRVKDHLTLREPLTPSSRVLAEFEGGHPFVITRQLGRGQVLLTTLDSHPKRGNLAACVGYLPLVRELLWLLSDGHSPRHNIAAGEREPWKSLTDGDRVRTPGGEWLSLPSAENEIKSESGTREEIISRLTAPGLYWIESAGEGPPTPISVAGVPEESDIRPAPKSYFDDLQKGDNLLVRHSGIPGDVMASLNRPDLPESGINPVKPAETSPEDFRAREIWGWLLAGLLGFLVLELLLAQRLLSGRRIPKAANALQ